MGASTSGILCHQLSDASREAEREKSVYTEIWAKCKHKQKHTPGVAVNSNYYYKLKRIRPVEKETLNTFDQLNYRVAC